ncbi:MAG: hypothetical protein CMQ15_13825 [Gammaproteobacteria bacterium]|nr:hypothetical protein [Gammaproteobacteria bacterium]
MKKPLFITTFTITTLLFLSVLANAKKFYQYIRPVSATCIRAIDGDTIIVNIAGVKERVRLIGVDTPETKHPRKPVQYAQQRTSLEIYIAQLQLKKMGFDPGSIDGKWGRKTSEAVRSFQKSIGIDVTGGLDSITYYALQSPKAIVTCRQAKVEMKLCLKILAPKSQGGMAGTASNACEEAFQRCESECENTDLIYDYDSGSYVSTDNTDYVDNCSDACRRGKNYCEDESSDENCYEFKRACNNDCPSDFFDYSKGEYRLITDAEDQCEDACRSGERACDSY